MKTLTIKDLAHTEALGNKAMAAVRGGMRFTMPVYPIYPSNSDSSVHAVQNLMQGQQVANSTANGSAFLDCLNVTNNTSQRGENNVNVGHGAPIIM